MVSFSIEKQLKVETAAGRRACLLRLWALPCRGWTWCVDRLTGWQVAGVEALTPERSGSRGSRDGHRVGHRAVNRLLPLPF